MSHQEATTNFVSDAGFTGTTSFYREEAKASLGIVDIIVIILYIVATFGVGIWVRQIS